LPEKKLTIKTIFAQTIMGKQDVMFYQTGRMVVNDLNTLNFLPGALADHLTSTGGDLLNDAQMSSLRWLESGATASYGTVSEPCKLIGKVLHGQHKASLLENRSLHPIADTVL
jgi:uncharacterized protein (TIGR03790 family)